MGFLRTMFSLASNKWLENEHYVEQKDCRGEGHKIRVASSKISIYPNPELLRTLRAESPIIMQFSANGSIFNGIYEMQLNGNCVVEKDFQFALIDFENILHEYGAIQIGLNGIIAGVYNSKGYFN